jgi:ketosteroid isomerase-like protein
MSSDFQAIADRVEIEALRGEFTDSVMMRDYDRAAALFTPDGALRMPNVPVELTGQEQIRAWGERVPKVVEFLVQNTHPGFIQLDGDSATGRAYMSEVIRLLDGTSELNYAIYHDRYQRTPDGWKFTERVYEVRYHDTSPLAGSAPSPTRGGRSRWRGDRRVLTRAGECVRDESVGLHRLNELPQERDGRVRPVLRGGDRLADLHEARLDQPQTRLAGDAPG